jgi:hypothetical protein
MLRGFESRDHYVGEVLEVTDMADDLISKALARIDELSGEMVRLQSWVNQADAMEGRTPRFGDLGAPVSVGAGMTARAGTPKWKPGQFLGKAFSAASRLILVARHEAAGEASPASVDEIHEALVAGSYSFDTNGAEAQKNSIRISLGKNSQTFIKLPNSDLFGLVEWYGTRGKKSARRGSGDKDDSVSAEVEDGSAAEVETDAAEP